MLHWRLIYPGDVCADEPEEQASIGLAPPGASLIVVTRVNENGERRAVVGEPLDEHGARRVGRPIDDYLRAPGSQPWQPVFYRKRSIALDLSGESRTDGVVFGRAAIRMDGSLDAALWFITRDGAIIDCPRWAIDLTAVKSLAEAR